MHLGNIVLKVTLDGEQTAYNESSITDGATLIMEADITVNELTPTRQDKITLNVVNGNDVETRTFEKAINFVAPTGMRTIGQITGFSDKDESVRSINSKIGIGELKINATKRNANVRIMAINNNEYNAKNVVILGRTPFEGNKEITSKEDLGSTFTAKMVEGIRNVSGLSPENMTIYYSANGEANQILNNPANGWVTDMNSVPEIKSYMIVLNNYTFNTGDVLGFEYTVEVPSDLGKNESTFGVFAVYYEKEEAEEISTKPEGEQNGANVRAKARMASNTNVMQIAEAKAVGLSTGTGPDLSVELVRDPSVTKVVENDIIKYTVNVKNNAKVEAKNVNVKIDLSDILSYVEYKNEARTSYNVNTRDKTINLKIDSIEPNKTEALDFYVKVGKIKEPIKGPNGKDLSEFLIEIQSYEDYLKEIMDANPDSEIEYEEYEEYVKRANEANAPWLELIEQNKNLNKINVVVTVSVDGYEEKYPVEKPEVIEPVAENKKLELSMTSNTENTQIKEGSEIRYTLNAKKNVSDKLDNVVITAKLQEGLSYVSSTNNGVYDENTRTITWEEKEFKQDNMVTFTAKVDILEDKEYLRNFKVEGNIKTDTENVETNVVSVEKTAYKLEFTATQNVNVKQGTTLAKDQEVIYEITVKNICKVKDMVYLTDTISNGLKFVDYYYVQDGNTVANSEDITSKNISIPIELNPNESVTVYIKAKTEMYTTGRDVTSKATIKYDDKVIELDTITHKINGTLDNVSNNPSGDDDDNNKDDKVNTYKISGIAWVDENKNGARDKEEKLLTAVKVYLLNARNSEIVETVTTNQKGEYNFQNIKEGTYVVAFEYDLHKYDLTLYKVDTVKDNVNSDVIDVELTLNGEKRKYGVTDNLRLTKDLTNVDIGLIDSPKFDLKLDKEIKLVQVSNSKTTKSYKFDGTKLAKIELPEKSMKGSVVAITYTFKVTNEGGVAGFANKIVDYKAKDLSFSSTLNPEWYEDTDGKLYNDSLNSVEIKPGETAEISLILTKTLTGENVRTIK